MKQSVCDSLAVNLSLDDAFLTAGIAPSTGYDWRAKGRALRDRLKFEPELEPEGIPEEEQAFLEFFEDTEQAIRERKERLLTVVTNDVLDNAETAKWLLTRLYPREFGDRTQVVIDEELKGFLEDARKELPPDVFQAVLRLAARRTGQ